MLEDLSVVAPYSDSRFLSVRVPAKTRLISWRQLFEFNSPSCSYTHVFSPMKLTQMARNTPFWDGRKLDAVRLLLVPQGGDSEPALMVPARSNCPVLASHTSHSPVALSLKVLNEYSTIDYPGYRWIVSTFYP
ncbi:hypothetical protein AB1N83_007555 [Pleurotus pulmonarius]